MKELTIHKGQFKETLGLVVQIDDCGVPST